MFKVVKGLNSKDNTLENTEATSKIEKSKPINNQKSNAPTFFM